MFAGATQCSVAGEKGSSGRERCSGQPVVQGKGGDQETREGGL